MHCHLCQKSEQEADLFDGLYESSIITVCKSCADFESIQLLRKPTQEQIQESERPGSVRQRLENLQDKRKLKSLSGDQEVASKNLAKIRFPPKKQNPEALVDNYYWKLQGARRSKKLSTEQLAEQTNIPAEIIENLEKGQVPQNFEQFIRQLENFFEIRLLKEHFEEPKFILPKPSPAMILEEEKEHKHEKESDPILSISKKHQERITEREIEQATRLLERGKQKAIKEIQGGKFDFSKKQNIENLTLNDLIELKKKKEQRIAFEKEKQEHQEMFGDELELDDELEKEIKDVLDIDEDDSIEEF